MWSRLEQWQDWAVDQFHAALHALERPQVQSLQFAYEKAGFLVRNEPIPWNAEAVLVEVAIRAPRYGKWPKHDFFLSVADQPPLNVDMVYAQSPDVLCLTFRLLPLREPTPLELCWRSQVVARQLLPFLSREAFVGNLRLQAPTLFARLGKHQTPCQALVAGQCRGLQACGLLTSATSLLPIVDLNCRVEFSDHRTQLCQTVPVSLSSAQLTCNRAILSATPPHAPEQAGTSTVRWIVGDRLLGSSMLRTVSQQMFDQSLCLLDARYVYEEKDGVRAFSSYLPARETISRLGACFRITSRLPGIAGLCRLQVRARSAECDWALDLPEEEVLVTDGPSPFMPPPLTATETLLRPGFDLLYEEQTLGTLTPCSRPVVTFTSEGGFKNLTEFDWTPNAEQELTERLGRLMKLPEAGISV